MDDDEHVDAWLKYPPVEKVLKIPMDQEQAGRKIEVASTPLQKFGNENLERC